MAYVIFVAGLAFLFFVLSYILSEGEQQRRFWGLLAIISSLIISVVSIYSHPVKMGLDLKGGISFLVEMEGNPPPEAMSQAVSVIRKRMDSTGMAEITIQPVGNNRISVSIPDVNQDQRASVEAQLSKVAKLEFRVVHQNTDQLAPMAAVQGLPPQLQDDWEVLTEYNRPRLPNGARDPKAKPVAYPIIVSKTVELGGKDVSYAKVNVDQAAHVVVELTLKGEGATRWAELTGQLVGQRLAIVLDKEVKSAPVIKSRIDGGQAVISGDFTVEEAQELASSLMNPLESPVKIIDRRYVDASLGADSVRSGFTAGIIATLGVIAYMVVYYRVAGAISVVALFANIVLLFGLLTQFQFTLTLPGIAGVVLTIGMAVDANVLIYERIRDEQAAGKPLSHAIDAGFDRAFSAILDSNVTTLIPAVILALLGSGPLRGFAMTLTLGIVANLFAAIVVSRNCFDWLLATKKLERITMMQFLANPTYDFLKYRWQGIFASVAVLALGCAFAYINSKTLLGIDFVGGSSLVLKFEKPVETDAIRKALTDAGISSGLVQYGGDIRDRVLQVQTESGKGDAAEKLLIEKFPDAKFKHGSLEEVGPAFGRELAQRALLALSLGLIGILVYSAIRFEWSFAIAATIGQIHDVLIALSFMAILNRELNLTLVGAFLTIAGYSINDKIVVFDRIREGIAANEKGTFYEIINRSLNLTLARTILTGGSCVIACLALIFFGGQVIHDFSVAMLIGILSGIYSSHFTSPVIAWWLDSYRDRVAAETGHKGNTAETMPA
ncbi:protein translocase subunit SecDF [Verrucomicrobia bacterium LW23]|nr:protein translocase subunit SecDF [Verrucomicrobia bacterium LW23]